MFIVEDGEFMTRDPQNQKSPYLLPQEESPPHVSPQSHMAGGPRAVLSTLGTSLREMGPFTGTQTLVAVNQQRGFDCPGCAWPDPEDHRSITEFCENGAKAVAEEATLKRVTPEFFKNHSVDALAEQTE